MTYETFHLDGMSRMSSSHGLFSKTVFQLILELLQTEEQSDSQEVQEQLDSVHLLVTNGWQEEVHLR